jgi:hypothetical protein
MTEIAAADIDAYMAAQKTRARAISERAEMSLARLGGETRPRRSRRTLDDLTAEEIDRDTRTMKKVLRAWKRRRLHHGPGAISRIHLPSGRELVYDWGREEVIK